MTVSDLSKTARAGHPASNASRATTQRGPLIALSGVSHRYAFRSSPALIDISAELQLGECVVICGANGGGKTTLLNIIVGKLRPAIGTVSSPFVPRTLAALRTVSYHSEEQNGFDFLTLRASADLFAAVYPRWNSVAFGEFCESLALPVDQTVASFSRGMKAKAHLALELACMPQVIVLEEPFECMDYDGRNCFMSHISVAVRETQLLAIYSSHRTEDIEGMATRLILLRDGAALLDCRVNADGQLQDRDAVVARVSCDSVRAALQMERCGVEPRHVVK